MISGTRLHQVCNRHVCAAADTVLLQSSFWCATSKA